MEWGTDHYDFLLEGVPTLVAEQDEANYLENYHAISDTFDKVDIPQLKKHVAEMTVVAYGHCERSGADRAAAHATADRQDPPRHALRRTNEAAGNLGGVGERQAGKGEIKVTLS